MELDVLYGTDVTATPWLDPAPFLRGVAWWDGGRAVRADPADTARLPWDTAQRAALPVGVRLEFASAGADAVEVRYRTAPQGRPRDSALPHLFALWSPAGLVGEFTAAPAAERAVTVPLPPAPGPYTLYLPESQAPAVLGLRGRGGALAPGPARPRWLVHGDSITEGWWSTRPAHAWPAAAGRALGLDAVNLGYAGAARGELPTAEQLAALPADRITLAFGTNCWSRTPHSAPLLYEVVRAYVALIRTGHPGTPLQLLSPVLRPEAEDVPNVLGATLGELRAAMERAVRDLVAAGDGALSLVPGAGILGPGHLADGLHPTDAGHARIAAAIARAWRSAPLPERRGA
ncbi:GDSL-type esterase/lipase family protein [Streptomyces sp. NPDC050504]|uniref:GDSL-type esterase/lipase family protein n=1 Tax=Streptomyces sp. NPDC050504 TaxID=3365618 RepID=UPI00379A15D9